MTAPRSVDADVEIPDWNDEVYDEPGDGPTPTRVMIGKRYRGEIGDPASTTRSTELT